MPNRAPKNNRTHDKKSRRDFVAPKKNSEKYSDKNSGKNPEKNNDKKFERPSGKSDHRFNRSQERFLNKKPVTTISHHQVLLNLRSEQQLRALVFETNEKIKDLLSGKETAEPSTEKQPVYSTPKGLLLDPWQYQALTALLKGHHIIVDAPTSAGKTRVIEAFLEYKLKIGEKLIYTSPVKSLSNDKYREFCEKYGREKVGINTGDFKENLNAPIILATLETYRNSLLGLEPNISRHVVVYDEYHFLQDESRGSAWEESLILTPQKSQLILLSASVPNCEDFATWIETLTAQKVEIIRVSKRPVPLVHMMHTKFGYIAADLLNFTPKEWQEIREAIRAKQKIRTRFRPDEAYQEMLEPIIHAIQLKLAPIILYAGRRGDVEQLALLLARHVRDVDPALLTKLNDRIANLAGWEYVPPDLQRIVTKYAIGFHHSGLIPPARVAIESLLKEGLLRLCCGTMGISLGVNFAVRSAIVFDETRPGEGGERAYTNTEIMQMLGRAGRRGHDKQGFSLWPNLFRLTLQQPRDREACYSSLKFDPTTILGVLGNNHSISLLKNFYEKSFFVQQLGDKSHNSIKNDLDKILKHLQKIGTLNEGVPTHFGQIARSFPQAGGLLIAHFLAKKFFTAKNYDDYIEVCACFCTAHFKEVPTSFANVSFLHQQQLETLIDKFYPEHLFQELYDELKFRVDANSDDNKVFREFNIGGASIVKQWLKPNTKWADLVENHSSKYFSEGDCMNVLFRFATFLQSLIRLEEVDEGEIAMLARRS